MLQKGVTSNYPTQPGKFQHFSNNRGAYTLLITQPPNDGADLLAGTNSIPRRQIGTN
jgi:hypothetical protein